jgi:hypothetical protein
MGAAGIGATSPSAFRAQGAGANQSGAPTTGIQKSLLLRESARHLSMARQNTVGVADPINMARRRISDGLKLCSRANVAPQWPVVADFR